MEKEILNKILEKHKKWLAKEEGGEDFLTLCSVLDLNPNEFRVSA